MTDKIDNELKKTISDLGLINARTIERLNRGWKTTIADLEKLKEKNEWLEKENDRLSRLVRQFNLGEGNVEG